MFSLENVSSTLLIVVFYCVCQKDFVPKKRSYYQQRSPPPRRPPHLVVVVVGVAVVVVVSAAGKNRENKVWRSPSFSSSVGGAAVVVVAPNRPAMPSRTGLGLGVVVMPSISWIFPTRIPIAMSPTRPLSSTSDTGEHVTMPQKQKKNRASIIFVFQILEVSDNCPM